MHAPRRLSVKLFAENPQAIVAEALVPVFQRWIQQDVFPDELLIDVADYKHVHHGPGILLVGHEGDYAYQSNQGRVGLSYTLKQHDSPSLRETLQTAIARVLRAVDVLNQKPELNGLSVSRTQMQITLLDRLHYPNNDEVVEATIESIREFLADFDLESHVERDYSDSREPIRFLVSTRKEFDLN